MGGAPPTLPLAAPRGAEATRKIPKARDAEGTYPGGMIRTCTLALVAALAAGPALAAKPPRPPRPLTPPLPASDCPECAGGTPSLAGSTAADLLAAWDAGGTGADFRVYHRVFDANGNAGPVVQVSPGTQVGLTAVVEDGNAWVLGFFNPGRVFVQGLDGAGAATGSPLLVNEPSEGDSHGSALALRGDRAVATFDVNRPGAADMVAQMLDGALRPVGPRVVLGPASYRARSSACIRPDGSAVVAWHGVVSHDPPRIALRLRLQGADSGLLGDLVELVPGTLAEPPAASVACAGDGSFAVAWHTNLRPHAKNGWDPVWQWFAADGRPRGPVTPLNVARKGDQRTPELLVLSNGTLLAVWASFDRGAATLRARRFAASGKPRGGELVLHRAPAGTILDPQLTLLPGTGRFALAWQERGQGWIRIFTE